MRCGANTAINNPQYFAFIVLSTDVLIHISVDSCDLGVGLQSALINACPWENSDVLDCDPGSPPGGVMELEASGLTITKTSLDLDYLPAGNYFLKFDFGEKGVLVKRIVIE